MIFEKPRRLPYILQLFILGIGVFISVTLFAQIKPLVQSFASSEEEYVFFGTPSYMTAKEWRVGKFFPWVDSRHRIRFNLHGDESASFYLYLSEEDLASLAFWFPMTYQEDGSITATHAEIRCYRISETEWVVSEIKANQGGLPGATLHSYHFKLLLFSVFWGLGFLGVSLAFFVSLIRRIR